MYLILLYPDGRRFEAMVLAAGPEHLRVALKDGDDALELRQVEGRWFSEHNEEIQFESWMAIEAGAETQDCFPTSFESARCIGTSGYASLN